jgi:hypothetical protein
MVLTTVSEVVEYTGAKAADFQIDGVNMTEAQWIGFIEALIPKVTQMIHRHCNVYSFERVTYTEYHGGRGAQNFDSSTTDYNLEDTIFFLKQLYCDTLLIYEDTSPKTAVPAWTLRTERSALAAGDYEVYQNNDVTRVQFYQHIPAYGFNNLKFIYYTGYPVDSVQINDIKFQCLRVCKNVIVQKKKIQEAFSIRNYGVRDYSQMFDVFSEDTILDPKVTAALDQYRRYVVPAQFAYD